MMAQPRSLAAAHRVLSAISVSRGSSFSRLRSQPPSDKAIRLTVAIHVVAASSSFSRSYTATAQSITAQAAASPEAECDTGSSLAAASATASPSPSSARPSSPRGLFGPVAAFLLPLVRPFRRWFGIEGFGSGEALYRRAFQLSSSPQLAAAYHLDIDPLTQQSPLTTLQMYLVHRLLLSRSASARSQHSAAHYSELHRSALEAWWSELTLSISGGVGGFLTNKHLSIAQKAALSLFHELDLAFQTEDERLRRRLLWAVLQHRLFPTAGMDRALEVRELARWLEESSARIAARQAASAAGQSAVDGAREELAELPPVREEEREAAMAEVELLDYAVEDGKLVLLDRQTAEPAAAAA